MANACRDEFAHPDCGPESGCLAKPGGCRRSVNRAGRSYIIEVPVTTLDDIIEEHELPRADLLKIDVEGLELEVLKGAGKSISWNKILCIQFEFNLHNAYVCTLFRDFVQLLPGFSFGRICLSGDVLLLDPLSYPLSELFYYQNIVATRTDIDQAMTGPKQQHRTATL
jgi:methyltransferase FkbM-like protein